MNNYFKNKLKDRLTYCKSWKHDIDMYLANKEITKQADEEFYKTRPFLKFVLKDLHQVLLDLYPFVLIHLNYIFYRLLLIIVIPHQ